MVCVLRPWKPSDGEGYTGWVPAHLWLLLMRIFFFFVFVFWKTLPRARVLIQRGRRRSMARTIHRSDSVTAERVDLDLAETGMTTKYWSESGEIDLTVREEEGRK